MKAVFTREAGKNDSLVDWLPKNSTFDEVPLTRTTYYATEEVSAALRALQPRAPFRSLVVTSERSHSYAALALGVAASDVQVFSVGPATSTALEQAGLTVHFEGVGGSLVLAPHVERGPVLVLGARDLRSDLVDALRERGLDVSVVACYETLPVVPTPTQQSQLREADVVFVGAPSAWAVAREFVDAHAWIVVPGSSTGAVVAAEHERVIEGWGPHLRLRLANIE